MKINIKTTIAAPYLEVFRLFNRSLFEQLVPPGAKVELIQFDGSKKGDRVHLRLFLPLVKPQDWISVITYDEINNKEAIFIDEGEKLPFFLAKWKHRHIVRNVDENTAEIIDAIEFSSPYKLTDVLLYPLLYVQFLWRKPIYKKFFKQQLGSSIH